MKILIADDDAEFRRYLETMLVRWGFEVVAVRDGNEAWLALSAEAHPQVAILDWMMPGMDGLELCRKVRQYVPEPYTYLMLLTSQRKDENLIAGMDAGADDYLTKPLKADELRVRLNAGRRLVELQNELVAARNAISAHASDLEAANRDLEAFGYAVSGNIVKFLLTIADDAKAIQEMVCRPDDEQCRSYTRRIYEKTRQMGQLIGTMQDFFRPMRIELRRESIDLSAMAGKTAEKFRRSGPERRVDFRITAGIVAEGDARLMGVVLDKLFDNAWKHTDKCDEAVIEFGLAEIDGMPAYFVRDNGTGFSMADAEKLFQPFQGLPGAQESTGQGIGLATVERIVRRHGGKVWAEGKPDKGATFHFTLPGSEKFLRH